MKYDVLLATKDKHFSLDFRKKMYRRRMRLDAVNTPWAFNRILRKQRKDISLVILDLDFSRLELNKIMFYIRRYVEHIPVLVVHGKHYSFLKESEAMRNLDVYGCLYRTLNKGEFNKLLDELEDLFDKDRDKKIENIDYLEKEKTFACTFKNKKTYFLKRPDIEDDDDSKIKNYKIDKNQLHFTVYLKSGKKYTVPWDFIKYLDDEEYIYYKKNITEEISAKEIGIRIRQARTSKQFKQIDLERKTGIKRANISRIEKGEHYPSLVTLEKLAEAMEVPVAQFLAKKEKS